MSILRYVLVGFIAFTLPPSVTQAATNKPGNKPAAKGPSLPSTRLRQMIDNTLPRINSITNTKVKPNRGAIEAAHTEWAALAQTAPPAEQSMYAAAANTAQALLGAIDEHDKAVATYKYSRSVHGPQDRQNLDISNGGQNGGTAFANNAKQNKENADNKKALREKEEFMSKGVLANWTERLPQISTAIEAALTAEVVSEKQMIAARNTPPPPPPAPASTVPPSQASAAQSYSPSGSWKAPKGTWTLTDDGNFTAPTGLQGAWVWGDRTKREITFTWRKSGETGKGVFSADGKELDIDLPNGNHARLTR